MSNPTQPLFDPFAPIEVQAEDSIGCGFLSPEEGDKLIFAVNFTELNHERLQEEFPRQIVSIVMDETMPDGVAMFPGDSAVETEFRAKQLHPETPIVTIDPFQKLVDLDSHYLEEMLYQEAFDQLEALAEKDEAIQDILFQDKDDEEKDKKEKKGGKDNLEFLDKVANGPVELFFKYYKPTFQDDTAYVYGYISSGKLRNFKVWTLDTGATHTSISKANYDRLVKKGAKPKEGPKKIAIGADGKPIRISTVTGIGPRFPRTGHDGKPEMVGADCPVIVGGFNLLGIDQLKKTMTIATVDPAGKSVTLKARPKPSKPKPKK